MLDLEPDRVIAFPGGPGTANMVYQAHRRQVPVDFPLEG
jgi:predicted polyphosphate/ATP-dependent NAD kinase